jgi:hypothetical protein
MKLILSRKGFDSASGGGPSPILPDGRMVSLPIPESAPAGVPYDELSLDAGRSYADVMRELHISSPAAGGGHLDPDLREEARVRPPGWRAAFGQCGAAQRHLALQGVGHGDLFLFFGLFQPCIQTDYGLAWDRRERPFHALWGYLEVDAIHAITGEDQATQLPWAADHPHLVNWCRPFNTVYVAADQLSLGPHLPGAGVFRYQEHLRLSLTGTLCSHWGLPAAFLPDDDRPTLSYHLRPDRWQRQGGRVLLQSVGRGQEFVIDCTPPLRIWLAEIIHLGHDYA